MYSNRSARGLFEQSLSTTPSLHSPRPQPYHQHFDEDTLRENIPEHKFLFANLASVKTVIKQLNLFYPRMVTALANDDVSLFTELLSRYASFFIRRLARDQHYRWEFLDSYQSIVLKFIEFYQTQQGIDDNTLTNYLPESAQITYAKLCHLCIDLFADYQELEHANVANLTEFSRLFILRPFLLKLLPLSTERLENLQQRSINLAHEETQRLLFRENMQVHVLSKNDKDHLLLAEVGRELFKIRTRYAREQRSHLRWMFVKDSLSKMRHIDCLYAMTQRKNTTLGEFTETLNTTLELRNLNRHRLRLYPIMRFFLKAPPRVVSDLRKIQNYLMESRIYPELIAHKLAQGN